MQNTQYDQETQSLKWQNHIFVIKSVKSIDNNNCMANKNIQKSKTSERT